MNVIRPNQVWGADITYIRLTHGFVYLVAVIDWYSRKVLSWRLSNTLDSDFCVACLERALQTYGTPEIFNTDQGCQFTSEVFIGVLNAHGIAISNYVLLDIKAATYAKGAYSLCNLPPTARRKPPIRKKIMHHDYRDSSGSTTETAQARLPRTM